MGVSLSLISHRYHVVSRHLEKIIVNRHVTRVCRILPFRHKNVFCIDLVHMSSSVGYQDLLEVVQEHAVLKTPSFVLFVFWIDEVDTTQFRALSSLASQQPTLAFLAFWLVSTCQSKSQATNHLVWLLLGSSSDAPRTTNILEEVSHFIKGNFVNPVHESDKVRSPSTFQQSLIRFSCITSKFG